MPRAFGYVRVSTAPQLKGESLEAQTGIIRSVFEKSLLARGVDLVEPFFQEQQSAYKREFLKRPAGMLLNSKLQRGDHVLFAIHTRAFRRAQDWSAVDALWRNKGVHYHYCNVPFLGHVDSSTGMGWMMYACMAAGAQMESEQRSLTTRTMSHYLRTQTQRTWACEHYGFEKVVNPYTGKKEFRPIIERLTDLYQWWFMRELGFTDRNINNVTDRNRQVREQTRPIVYHYSNSFREIADSQGMISVANGFWEIMSNPFYRPLLPQLEQTFRQRWAHMPYGVPDYRGPQPKHTFHLLHPSILLHDGPNKGMPAMLFSPPLLTADSAAYDSAFRDLAAHQPKTLSKPQFGIRRSGLTIGGPGH